MFALARTTGIASTLVRGGGGCAHTQPLSFLAAWPLARAYVQATPALLKKRDEKKGKVVNRIKLAKEKLEKKGGKEKGTASTEQAETKKPEEEALLIQREASHLLIKTDVPEPDLIPWGAEKATPSNIGKVTSIPRPLLARFESTMLPKTCNSDFAVKKNSAFLLRKEVLELISILETSMNHPRRLGSRLLLNGPAGSGKSVIMFLIAAHFADKGFCTIYIPRSFEFINGSQMFTFNEKTKMYEQPMLAQLLCTQLSEQNGEIFSKILLARNYEFKNSLRKGVNTVADLVKESENLELSTGVAVALLDELTKNESRPPLFFAVDQINSLFSPQTFYFDINSENIHSSKFALANALRNIITAPCERNMASMIGWHASSNLMSGSEFSDIQFSPAGIAYDNYPIKGYSLPELSGLLEYYKNARVSSTGVAAPKMAEKILTLTDGIPSDVYRVARVR